MIGFQCQIKLVSSMKEQERSWFDLWSALSQMIADEDSHTGTQFPCEQHSCSILPSGNTRVDDQSQHVQAGNDLLIDQVWDFFMNVIM